MKTGSGNIGATVSDTVYRAVTVVTRRRVRGVEISACSGTLPTVTFATDFPLASRRAMCVARSWSYRPVAALNRANRLRWFIVSSFQALEVQPRKLDSTAAEQSLPFARCKLSEPGESWYSWFR